MGWSVVHKNIQHDIRVSLAFINDIGSTQDFGTHQIGKQRRLNRACANPQSHQSLHNSHTQSTDLFRGRFRPKIRFLALLDMSVCAFKGGFCTYALSIKISYAGL